MEEKALVKMVEKLLCEHYQVTTKEEFFHEDEDGDPTAIELIWDTMVEEAVLAFYGRVSDEQKLRYLIGGVTGTIGE